jgi:hypothetical protein
VQLKFIVSIILLTALSAFAGPGENPVTETNLVFGVEGTLIQVVPKEHLDQYDKSKLIQVGERYYRVADGAADAIRRLALRPGVKISFFSEFPKAETDQALKLISDQSPNGESLSALAVKVLSREDMTPYKDEGAEDPYVRKAPQKDLTKISKDISHTILIDDNSKATIPGQEANLFYYHHPLYQFETYAKAQTTLAELEKKDPKNLEERKLFFPSSEDEWKLHQERIPAIYDVLAKSVDQVASHPSVSLSSAVSEQSKIAMPTHIQDGLEEMESHFDWKTAGPSSKDIVGCVEKSRDNKKVLRELPIEICKKVLPTHYQWVTLNGGAKKNSCATFAENGAQIGVSNQSDCISALGVHYLWVDKELKHCGVFTKEYVFIKDAESAAQCGGQDDLFCRADDGVLTQITRKTLSDMLFKVIPNTQEAKDKALEGSCDQPSGPISVDDSPNKDYFKKLLKEGTQAPLDKFLKLWYPNKGDGSDKGAYFFQCEPAAWGAIQGGSDGFIPENCAPDVLYSWGPRQKLELMEQAAADGKVWTTSLNPTPLGMRGGGKNAILYATISAVATYEYGEIPVRIKLKPHTRVRVVGAPAGEANEVNYYYWGGHDFYITDGSIVDSWSYGTPEQYDETIRDIIRLQSGKRGIAYTTSGAQQVANLPAFDGHVTGESVIKHNLLEMIREILSGEGRIFYSKGACRNLERHFSTDKHSYMNP